MAQSALEAVYGAAEVHPSALETAQLALRMVASPNSAIADQLGLLEGDLWTTPSANELPADAGRYAAVP
jgi:hypothetical protein